MLRNQFQDTELIVHNFDPFTEQTSRQKHY